LQVKIRPDAPLLAIRILDETSAYQLWVNGKRLSGNGKVGTTETGTKPQYLLQMAHVSPDRGQLDIVLQVANFSHAKGGVWNPITLGAEGELYKKQELMWGLDFFLFGALLVMGAYHVCLFLLRRQDLSVLFFGLFCLVVACRTALTEDRLFTYYFPDFSWEMVFKIELFTVHAAFLLLLLFIHSLYPSECSSRLMRILQGISLTFGLITLATCAKVSSLLVAPFHPVIIFIQGYIFYVLIKAIRRKRGEAATILVGLLIFFLAVINDILHNHGVIATAYVAPFGFMFLVGSQSLALARRYSQAFITGEQLSAEREEHIQALSEMNQQISSLVASLQKEVDEHTAANLALEEQMTERNRLELEIVRVSDNERVRISHELHDGLCQQLTGARLRCAALESMLATAGVDSTEVQPLGKLLDEAVNHAYDLSRGLWPLELDLKGVMLSLEELIRRISEQSGIAMEFHRKLGCEACATEQLTQIYNIAREAITNAVKHSRATLVTVSLECSVENGIVLRVCDNGIGRNTSENTGGGMGIGIMTHRAFIIGGCLQIFDAEGGGTLVVCTVPCYGQSRVEAPNA
jgi:signal transduction histidine kinase